MYEDGAEAVVVRVLHRPISSHTFIRLTTFPICYAMCMRNHRVIIRNVVGGADAVVVRVLQQIKAEGAPVSLHTFISFNNIFNIVRYL